MAKTWKILLLAGALAGLAWVALRVEFGGATLWERVAGLAPARSPTAGPPDGDGAPMDSVRPEEQRALDRLIADEGKP